MHRTMTSPSRPLSTSTHLVVTGSFPVILKHSSRDYRSQTPSLSMNHTSSLRTSTNFWFMSRCHVTSSPPFGESFFNVLQFVIDRFLCLPCFHLLTLHRRARACTCHPFPGALPTHSTRHADHAQSGGRWADLLWCLASVKAATVTRRLFGSAQSEWYRPWTHVFGSQGFALWWESEDLHELVTRCHRFMRCSDRETRRSQQGMKVLGVLLVETSMQPEVGTPQYLVQDVQAPPPGGRSQKPAHGMNDAPRRWWNILDKALRTYGMVPTRADRSCHVLCSKDSRVRDWEHWRQRCI